MKPETIAVMKLVEDIRDVDSDIFELQERKKRLEHQLDEMISPRSNVINLPAAKPGASRPGRVSSDTSAKRRIQDLLNADPDNRFSADDVSFKLDLPLGTARTNLSRLVRKGLIEKRGFNGYGAVRQKKEAPEEAPLLQA